VTLPQIQLDDRGFQQLVSEARLRVARSCPEWTEHNVSDPGITLIELFAWMTDMLVYRLNRLPDKLHVALMDLLGITLDPPVAAHTDLRFRLAAPASDPVDIPAATEVGTRRTATAESVIFGTDEAFRIPALRPSAYLVQRAGELKDVGVADGTARPQGSDQLAFATPPQVGDALLLGFDEPLGRLVMHVAIEASVARGAGVDPEDPPLRWEVSEGDGRWAEAEVLEDLTGGFNYGSGTVELQCPPSSAIEGLGGKRLHWLRCRVDDRTRHGGAGTTYSHPPEIYSVTAAPIGALLAAQHAGRERDEWVGTSDGTPGQTFTLRFGPVLPLAAGETLEVREPDSDEWVAWEPRDSFAGSSPRDRHFTVDLVHAQLALGPSVREADGGWTQYGALPPKGSALRMTSYRHGGGREGNVAAGALTMLKSAIPGVARVANPRPAFGGVDAEPLSAARERAAIELRTRYRAVTAEDFEFLAGEASPRVARAVCVAPAEGEAVQLRLLPRVDPADRRLTIDELTPDERMLDEVGSYLDERRLVGTSVQLLPVRFRGISVVVQLQAEPLADLGRVEQEVLQALYTYLNPLVGGSPEGPAEGWPFGRALNQGELYGIVHAVGGVEFVKILRLYETDLRTGEQAAKPTASHLALEPDEVIASGNHIVKAVHRAA
jgi:predicted phage baseplate assembly protein